MNVVATSISGTNVQLVVSSLTDQSQVVCIDRPYSALEKLHAFLVKKHGAINIPSFPLFPSNATDAKLAVLCAELTAYFKCDKVYESDEVRSLVDEEITAGSAHMTAIDFILQPFEYVKLQVTSAGQSLVWKFEVEDYDIEFYAEFHTPFPMYTEIFHAATKYQTTSKPVEGAPMQSGTWLLTRGARHVHVQSTGSCNPSMGQHVLSASKVPTRVCMWHPAHECYVCTSKSLLYLAHVVDKNMMESALAAADALNQVGAGPTSGNCLRLQKSPLLKTTAGTPRLPIMPSLEQLTPQWLMDGLMQTTSATASYAAKLFGSRHPPLALAMSSEEPDACGNSLIQELNDLNMKLLQRVKPSSPREDRPVKDPHLKDDVRQALEKELGQAELTLLRVRAQLGYSLHHHVPVRSAGDRLERLANVHEHQIVKYKSHKKVLVTELRNLKRETDGQVAVAMAEACEARMVNQSLKRQNELLLTQMRAMVDDNNAAAKSADIEPTASPLISTITAADIALLNGQPEVKMLSQVPHEQPNPYRERLLRFFQEHDPSQIDQVDDMLESYRGVEDSLMDSLHLKYTFQHLA
ncbi:hypothetical protein DYB32_003191 [Aphanomyces invadans]|uniref:GOLD domain-containing protein n=1 Tax=Aphanomyces invadans TaxID=157072 RepID=A0A3R7D312_9STRA|nr:hypothetical protein DYB32_003191 [Aphanomyces invadans]